MVKKGLILLVLLVVSAIGRSQTSERYMSVLMKFEAYYNMQNSDSIGTLFSTRMKKVVTVEQITTLTSQLYSKYGEMLYAEPNGGSNGFFCFTLGFRNGRSSLITLLNDSDRIETFRIVPYDRSDDKNVDSNNIVIYGTKYQLAGTLSVPRGGGTMPVVIMVPGSGSIDRRGNEGTLVHANSYQQMSDSLCAHHIACLRYDKPGVGDSKLNDNAAMLTYDDMVTALESLVKKVRADHRFSEIILAGDHDGALTAMLAAQKVRVNKLILINGFAAKGAEILLRNMAKRDSGILASAKQALDSLALGKTVKVINEQLHGLLQSDLEPYLISWFRYDPLREIYKIQVPVLIVQGQCDIQLDGTEGSRLAKLCRNGHLVVLKDLNSVMKNGNDSGLGNAKTYLRPDVPVLSDLVNVITGFINDPDK